MVIKPYGERFKADNIYVVPTKIGTVGTRYISSASYLYRKLIINNPRLGEGFMSTVTFADIQAAAARLKGIAHHTPVMTSRTLDEQVGAQVYLKCENLQRVGAFKFRGAYNAISQLNDTEKARGV